MKRFGLGLLAGFGALLLIAAGTSRYINGTEIKPGVTLLYSSGSQAATLGAVTATSVSDSGTLSVTGAATLSSAASVAGATTLASSLKLTSVGTVAATGPTGSATGAALLSNTINAVTAATGSLNVTLPTAVTGLVVILGNQSTKTVALYPYTGDAINASAADQSLSVSTAKSYVCAAPDADHWLCSGN